MITIARGVGINVDGRGVGIIAIWSRWCIIAIWSVIWVSDGIHGGSVFYFEKQFSSCQLFLMHSFVSRQWQSLYDTNALINILSTDLITLSIKHRYVFVNNRLFNLFSHLTTIHNQMVLHETPSTHNTILIMDSVYVKNTFPKSLSNFVRYVPRMLYLYWPLDFGKVIQLSLDFVSGQITFPTIRGPISYKLWHIQSTT